MIKPLPASTSILKIKRCLLVGLLVFWYGVSWGQITDDYRTRQSGNWNAITTWERYSGTTWQTLTGTAPLTFPTSGDGVITIFDSHTVSVTAAVTVDQVVISAGGQVTISSAQTLTINNGAGTDLSVSGTLQTNSVSSNAGLTNNGQIQFLAEGIYIHNVNGEPIPTAIWASTSTARVTGTTSTDPTGLNQNFGNFSWNATGLGTNPVNFNPTGIVGNLEINNGSSMGQIIQTIANLTIGGDLIILGGVFSIASGNNNNRTLTVTGNIEISGGTLNIKQNNNGSGTLNVAGNFTHTGGIITRSGSGTASINFNGSGIPQIFTSGGTVSSTINWTVNSGAFLQIAAEETTVTGAGAFTLQSGSTLGITSSAGITTTGATGNIQVTGSRTYNTGANYIYNGNTNQAVGNGLPVSLNNLTIANTGTAGHNIVTVDANKTITSNLTVTSGTLNLATFTANRGTSGGLFNLASNCTLQVGGPSNFPSNYAANSIHCTSTIEYNASGNQTLGAVNYGNLVLSGSGSKTIQAGTTQICGDFSLSGTASTAAVIGLTIGRNVSIGTGTTFTGGNFTHAVGGDWTRGGTFTATGSTIDFNGTSAASIGISNFQNVIFSGAGAKTAIGALSIDGIVSISNNFTAGAFTHNVGGNWTRGGTFTATGSTIDFNGTTAASIGISNFQNVTFSGAGAKTATGALIIAGNISISNNFTAGAFTHTVGGNWTNSGTFTPATSTITFNANGPQSISAANFYLLNLSGSGDKSFLISTAMAENFEIEGTAVARLGSSNHTANKLFLGTAGQAASSYGSIASTAIFKIAQYFGSNDTGILNVAINAANCTNGTWLGATSSDWNTASNWCNSIIPDLTSDVIIPQAAPIQPIIGIAGAKARNLTIESGATLSISGAFLLEVAGSYTSNGTFNSGTTSTVEFKGTANSSINSSSFANVTFSGAGAKTATGALSISGNISISNNFTAGAFTHNVGGNWTRGGTFTAAGSTIDFNGASAASIGISNFQNVTFSGAGAKTATGALTIAGNVSISNNFTAGAFTHTVGGNWTRGGTFTATGSTIEFNGTNAGSIGISNFENLIFTGTGIKTINGILTVLGNITPVSTPVILSNPNTLTLNAGKTMEILATGSFTTSGTSSKLVLAPGANYLNRSTSNPRLEVRQLFTGTKGWRLIGTPISSSYNLKTAGFETQGFPGSTNPSLQPNLLWWDETDKGTTLQGWRKPTNLSITVPAGRGHYFYIFNGAAKPSPAKGDYTDGLPLTMSTTGSEVNLATERFDFEVTFTAREFNLVEQADTLIEVNHADEGFNLIANPTASMLDWNAKSGWFKTHMDESIYVWDPKTSSFLTWNGSSGTLENGQIAPYQGFWVRSNAASPSLRLTGNGAKTLINKAFYGRTIATEVPALIHLQVNGENLQAESFISFGADGLEGVDPKDAYQLESLAEEWVLLYTYGSIKKKTPLVINHLNTLDETEKVIPLHLAASKNGLPIKGSYLMNWTLPTDLPAEVTIVLMDHISQKAIDMRKESAHAFTFEAPRLPNARIGKSFDPLAIPKAVVFHSPYETGEVGPNARKVADKPQRPFTIFISGKANGEIGYLPDLPKLIGPMPNPFNTQTKIRFYLPETQNAEIQITDMLGQVVGIFPSDLYKAGIHELDWIPSAIQLHNGMYVIRLSTDNYQMSQKLIKN